MHKLPVLFLFFVLSSCQGSQEEQDVLKKILDKYDTRVTASSEPGSPTKVSIEIFLLKLRNIDEVKGNADLGLKFVMKWNDSRLAWDNKKVKELTIPAKQIWIPDMCMSAGQGIAKDCFPASDKYSATVLSTGEIHYSYTVNKNVECLQEMENTGIACTFQVEGWAMTSDILKLKTKTKVIDTSLLGTYVDPNYKIKSATYDVKVIQYPTCCLGEKFDLLRGRISLVAKK